eukprot:scaffold36845_cov168-Amphora_coffeaeformis.AAC.1
MKFVALVSGGKDSIFSILEAEREGHELVACVHLARPVQEDEESYMYQTAGSEVVQTLVEECIQVPLVHYVRQGKSVQTTLVYEESKDEGDTTPDEVEDLFLALQEAVRRFPSVQAVASGALLSTYQRVRIENVCQRLGLTSLSYLWRQGSQHEILRSMIQAELEVVLVRTAAPPGLMPRRHLHRSLRELESHLYSLYDRYRMHVCGEGGEYESLCLYAPGLYRKRLVLDEVEIRTDENDDGVGVLIIKSCHAQELDPEKAATNATSMRNTLKSVVGDSNTTVAPKKTDSPRTEKTTISWSPPPKAWLPHVRRCEGGLWHTSGILSPIFYPPGSDNSEADLAVQEARDVLYLLRALLRGHQCTAQDVGMVHLYLSDMAHFQRINQYYRECFGVLLPPSRSCVALGDLPKNRRVMLDCWVLAGSGEYMRRQGTESNQKITKSPYAKAALANTSIRYRSVLHVQSLSHWAPVCVGPYSQTNTLLGALHFLAGSIGLWPASMILKDSWDLQLEQSWKNLAQILDALDQSSLGEHVLSGMVYVSDKVYDNDMEETATRIRKISQKMMSSNAGVVPGLIDDIVAAGGQHGGYEDEETRMAMESSDGFGEEKCNLCPLLLVAIPAMPVGAQVEVELVTATHAAASCMPVTDFRGRLEMGSKSGAAMKTNSRAFWDAGYDFDGWPGKSMVADDMEIIWSFRTLGVAGAGLATIVAASDRDLTSAGLDVDLVLSKMIEGLSSGIANTARSITFDYIFQIRVYYVSIEKQENKTIVIDIASQIECALNAALPKHIYPAITIIPVHGIEYLDLEETTTLGSVVLALQATFLDPISLQTELWIRQGRPSE